MLFNKPKVNFFKKEKEMMYYNFSINIFVMKKSNKRSNSDLIWFLVGTTKWTVFLFTGVIMSFISGVLKKKKKMGK